MAGFMEWSESIPLAIYRERSNFCFHDSGVTIARLWRRSNKLPFIKIFLLSCRIMWEGNNLIMILKVLQVRRDRDFFLSLYRWAVLFRILWERLGFLWFLLSLSRVFSFHIALDRLHQHCRFLLLSRVLAYRNWLLSIGLFLSSILATSASILKGCCSVIHCLIAVFVVL